MIKGISMLDKIDSCATPTNNIAVNNPPDLTKNDPDLDLKVLAATFNAIADAVIATDVNAHVTKLNLAAEKLTGWKQAEAIGRPIDEIFYIIQAKTRQPVIAPVIETLAQRLTIKLTKGSLLLSQDGSEHIIEGTCTPIISLNNQIIGALMMFRDVTDEESVQIALRKSEQLFRATFNNASVGIAHVAHDGQLLRINSHFSRMVGYSVDELLSNEYQKITHPNDLAQNSAGYQQMLAGEVDSFSIEKRYIRKDNSIFWADLEVSCERDANGEIDYFIAVVFDISARKDAIQYSRRFFLISQEMLGTAGFDGYFKKINGAFEKILGYSEKEILAKPFVDFVHPEDKEKTLAEIVKLSPGENTQVFENRYICKNGEVRNLLWSIVTVLDEQLFYCSARDITERKKVEQDLQIRTQQFECLINAAPFGIYLLDDDFRILQVNLYALPSFGDTSNLIGRNFGEVIHSIWPTDKANEVIETFKHTLVTGESSVMKEITGQRVDNKLIEYYAWEIHRIPLPNGKPGVVCYFQDISQRVLTQQKICASEWRLRYATESAKLTFVEIDLARGAAYTPENFAAVMGYASPPEQESDGAIGVQALLEHIVPDDRPLVQESLDKFFNGEPIGKIDYRVLGDDQVERWIESKWSVELGQGGQPSKSFATNIDITERKHAELIAVKASLAKSEFLSRMSHELRTPLNAILGFAQLLESSKTPLTDLQKRNTQEILHAGWYLLELINEILDLAQIESGQQVVLLEAVSVNEVMRECANLIVPLALKQNINVNFNALADDAIVHADKTRLKQILINLLSNAIKYNKVDGTVTVNYTLSQNVLRICIIDTGEGLNSEQLNELFQPFNRLGRQANLEEGTGIGLIVCKRLIELMHGKIGVKSEVEVGSEFWIELDLIA